MLGFEPGEEPPAPVRRPFFDRVDRLEMAAISAEYDGAEAGGEGVETSDPKCYIRRAGQSYWGLSRVGES